MLYELMHKYEKVCLLDIGEIGAVTKVEKVFDENLLPLGGNQSATALKTWWARRAVPTTQAHVNRLLEKMNKTNQAFLADNLGLSMTDHYWICPVGIHLEWGQINFYENDFLDGFADQMFSEQANPNISERVPGCSSQGDLIKKWLVQDGKRFLMKGNTGNFSQQSLNEVLATEIHKRQAQQPYVEYKVVPHPTEDQLCCISEAFTSENLEFIPAIDVINSQKKRNEISYYEHFISVCDQHGLKTDQVRDFLEYEILTDFIISNTDRHLNNFGILRDGSTLEFVSMAPIFDSGNSMFFDKFMIPKGDSLYSVKTNSFKNSELEMLKYVQKKDRINLDLLPDENYLRTLYSQNYMPEERIEGLITAFSQKKKMLKEFVLTKKINTPGYNHIRKPHPRF